MYAHPHEIEPLLPTRDVGELEDLAIEVIRESATLGASLAAGTRSGVVDLTRTINSYYSNLIEGHDTHPIDVERAFRQDYAKDSKKRALQFESTAHIAVQRRIEERLQVEPDLDVCSSEFLTWVHRAFYERMPEEFHWVQHGGERERIVSGALRAREVQVGRHVAPTFTSIEAFLRRFDEAYAPSRLRAPTREIAAAASHHRLGWIHPFLDGNGRVMRLFTHAYLERAGIGGHGLWSVSRGLARRRAAYLQALEEADEPRRGALDGRGNLSDRALHDFCVFFLDTALDQIRYMREQLDLDGLEERILGFVELAVARGETRHEAAYLLRDVMLRGEVARGEAARITGMSERSARYLLAELLAQGLLSSSTAKGPLRLGIPPRVVPYYFPRLYPGPIEHDLTTVRPRALGGDRRRE